MALMPAIVAPQPRLPSSTAFPLASESPLTPIAIPDSAMDTDRAAFFTPPPLLSPIDLTDRVARKPYVLKSPPPCSSTKRRRRPTSPTPRLTRRRACPRPDCMIRPIHGASAFDNLPWISRMDAPPSLVSVWDTADLSLLSIDSPQRNEASTPGPIRGRKSSLRSSPRNAAIAHLIERRPSPLRLRDLDSTVFNLIDHSAADPRTPSPRHQFAPTEVRFQGLHPILPMEDDPSWAHQ